MLVANLTDSEKLDRLLGEQLAYYRALAADYLDQDLDLPGGEAAEALEAFQPRGSVLELACGPGVWTGQLLRYATDVTAVDASPEMLAMAAARAGSERVRFTQADLFTWRPGRRYDVVFFGFWLSHVPAERFESFWSAYRLVKEVGPCSRHEHSALCSAVDRLGLYTVLKALEITASV